MQALPETKRLFLREWMMQDLDAWAAILSDAEVTAKKKESSVLLITPGRLLFSLNLLTLALTLSFMRRPNTLAVTPT